MILGTHSYVYMDKNILTLPSMNGFELYFTWHLRSSRQRPFNTTIAVRVRLSQCFSHIRITRGVNIRQCAMGPCHWSERILSQAGFEPQDLMVRERQVSLEWFNN